MLIPSSKVATYDLEPEMQAAAIAKRAAEEIASGRFGVVVMNFANPDMVGHTGNMACDGQGGRDVRCSRWAS